MGVRRFVTRFTILVSQGKRIADCAPARFTFNFSHFTFFTSHPHHPLHFREPQLRIKLRFDLLLLSFEDLALGF